MPLLKRFWEKWKALGLAIGRFQTKWVLNLVYYVLFLPVGLLCRWKTDVLGLRSVGATSGWCPRDTRPPTLEDLRQQS